MRPNILPLLSVVLLSTGLGPARALDLPANNADLRSQGPFPVGVTTTVFVDSSRTDAFTKEPRTLVTEIWYPATDDARQLPKNKYSDFLPGGVTPEIASAVQQTSKKTVSEIDEVFRDEAV